MGGEVGGITLHRENDNIPYAPLVSPLNNTKDKGKEDSPAKLVVDMHCWKAYVQYKGCPHSHTWFVVDNALEILTTDYHLRDSK